MTITASFLSLSILSLIPCKAHMYVYVWFRGIRRQTLGCRTERSHFCTSKDRASLRLSLSRSFSSFFSFFSPFQGKKVLKVLMKETFLSQLNRRLIISSLC